MSVSVAVPFVVSVASAAGYYLKLSCCGDAVSSSTKAICDVYLKILSAPVDGTRSTSAGPAGPAVPAVSEGLKQTVIAALLVAIEGCFAYDSIELIGLFKAQIASAVASLFTSSIGKITGRFVLSL